MSIHDTFRKEWLPLDQRQNCTNKILLGSYLYKLTLTCADALRLPNSRPVSCSCSCSWLRPVYCLLAPLFYSSTTPIAPSPLLYHPCRHLIAPSPLLYHPCRHLLNCEASSLLLKVPRRHGSVHIVRGGRYLPFVTCLFLLAKPHPLSPNLGITERRHTSVNPKLNLKFQTTDRQRHCWQ